MAKACRNEKKTRRSKQNTETQAENNKSKLRLTRKHTRENRSKD